MSRREVSSIGWMRCLCAAGLLVCGTAMGAVLFGVDGSRADSVAHRPARRAPIAAAAKIETANQTLVLRITKIANTTINAEGWSSKEPLIGNIGFYMTLINASRAKVNFTGGSRKGSIRGVGVANYHVSGATSYFKGGVTTLAGTGKFTHYKSLGMTFSGTLNRRTFKVSVTVLGKWIP